MDSRWADFLRSVQRGLQEGSSRVTAGSALPPDMGISGGVDRREAQRLRRRNQQLEEENNLLRLKVDILLDMVRSVMGKRRRGFPVGGDTPGSRSIRLVPQSASLPS